MVPRAPDPGAPAPTGISDTSLHEGQILPFCLDALFTSCITAALDSNQNNGTPRPEEPPDVSTQRQDPLSVAAEDRDDHPTEAQSGIPVRMFNRFLLNFFSSTLFRRLRKIHNPGVPV